jgi:hypothetical protein
MQRQKWQSFNVGESQPSYQNSREMGRIDGKSMIWITRSDKTFLT